MTKITKEKVYCQCCGYNSIDERGSYEICPICYWEEDFIQEDHYFFWGGANSIPLFVAKVNYEKLGAVDERFSKLVIKPTNYKRDPAYLSADQVLSSKREQLKNAVLEDINSRYDNWEALNYYLDNFYKNDLSFSRYISERIFQKENMRYLWVKIAGLYFVEFKDKEAIELKNHLLKECHNSWEELQELLNSLG